MIHEWIPQLIASFIGAVASYVAIRSDLAVLKERTIRHQNQIDNFERKLYEKCK